VVSTKATTSEVEHRYNTKSPLSIIPALTRQATYSGFVNSALEVKPRGFFADQFENDSNFQAHYLGTGPEILRQTAGNIDAFVSGAGKLMLLLCVV
jgi:cysteine synthase A